MKPVFLLLLFILTFSFAHNKPVTFEGSTPAHHDVRSFLGISLSDSIDFIRWKLVLTQDHYDLQCRYGISKPGTPGFIDEKRVSFAGNIIRKDKKLYLHIVNRELGLLVINFNLLHVLDKTGKMLIGNGGYSYTLNIDQPQATDKFNALPVQSKVMKTMVYEGRTPCQELSRVLGLNKGPACDKMKWYIVFLTDSITGKPSIYLAGGRHYRRKTMDKGKWQIVHGKEGRTIYQLDPERSTKPIYLLKAGNDILYFTDASGNLLVGNKDFSYTLNRRNEEYKGY